MMSALFSVGVRCVVHMYMFTGVNFDIIILSAIFRFCSIHASNLYTQTTPLSNSVYIVLLQVNIVYILGLLYNCIHGEQYQ